VARIHTHPDEEFEGTVESVALTYEAQQGGAKYYRTEISLKPDGRTVFCGSTADVDIQTKCHEAVLKVPSQAVLERKLDDLPAAVRKDNPNVDEGKTYAAVVYRLIDGKTVATPVQVGPSDQTHTAIGSGVDENDAVIVGPYKVLENVRHDQDVKEEGEEAEAPAQEGETDADPQAGG
jgi:HlyD family secretion protein